MVDEVLAIRLDLDPEVAVDASERGRMTQQLRRQLLALDVERVELVRTDAAPAGSKSAEAITVGALMITLAPTALAGAFNLLQDWLNRHAASSIQVSLPGKSITLTGGRPADTQRLIDAFLSSPAGNVEEAGD